MPCPTHAWSRATSLPTSSLRLNLTLTQPLPKSWNYKPVGGCTWPASEHVASPGVVRNIPKISPPKSPNLTVFCLFWSNVCGGMQSAGMQSIVLLIALLCFQVELDWFTESAAVVQLCCSRWPYVEVCWETSFYCTRKASCTLLEPWRHSDGVLKNLWARCHCRTTPQRLTFTWTALWRFPRRPMFAKFRRMVQVEPSTVRR